jgi:hypothetical protein
MAKRKQSARGWVKQDDRLFTLEVCITGGPMTEKFIKKNKVVCRTIQIRGDQTLEDLHFAIFDAFDREEQHMFEFIAVQDNRALSNRPSRRGPQGAFGTGLGLCVGCGCPVCCPTVTC